MDIFQQVRGVHRLHMLVLHRFAEAYLDDLHDILLLHKLLVELLDTRHLVIIKPIRCLLFAQFIDHLRIELVIVYLA